MLKIMASHQEGEEEEEDLQEETNQSQSPTTLAAQVYLSLSLSLSLSPLSSPPLSLFPLTPHSFFPSLLHRNILLLFLLTTGLGYSCPVSSS